MEVGLSREETNRRDTIVITGVGGGVGQAILRALRLAQTDYRIVGLDMDPRGAGLYQCDEAYVVPAAKSSSYVSSLKDILARECPAVLLPGSDPELLVLARARSELEVTGTRVLVGSPAVVSICRDKLESARFFREHGSPFVRTVAAADALALADEVGFPLVVKPSGGSASRDVTVAFQRDDLAPYLNRTGYVVQEFAVPSHWNVNQGAAGQDAVYKDGALRQEDEISVQVVFDHEASLLGMFCSVNRLQSGVPMFVDPASIPEAEAVIEKMAWLLAERGLIGPCNFQCRLAERGPMVFEINPRFTGISGVRAAMDFNAVDAVLRRMLVSESVESARSSLRRRMDVLGMRFVDEITVSRERFKGDGA
jgi:carbamoylphosphate synthase large subunit